jgi:hypothetical protein
MDSIIKVIFEKLSIIYIAMIFFLTSAAVIFLPGEFQEKLMLYPIKAEYDKYLGPIFIVSGAYLLVAISGRLISFFSEWKRRRDWKNLVLERLQDLAEDEISVLLAFYEHDSNIFRETASLNCFDRRVKLLESYGIIIRLASSGIASLGLYDNEMTCVMPYKLNGLARKKLNVEFNELRSKNFGT